MNRKESIQRMETQKNGIDLKHSSVKSQFQMIGIFEVYYFLIVGGEKESEFSWISNCIT